MRLDQPWIGPCLPGRHDQKTKPQPTTQRHNILIPRRPALFRRLNREINGVKQRLPRHTLQDKAQIEAQLHLNNQGRVPRAQGHDVTSPDLRLHLIALRLEKGLQGRIEVRLFHRRAASR